MRGRRAEPAEVKLAKGNPGRRRVAVAGDDLPAATLAPPKHLTAKAREAWQSLASELVRMKFLRSTDQQAFARYCNMLSRYWEADRRSKAADMVYETESKHGKMLRVNPWLLVMVRLERALLDFEDRFGLSPAARQRILLQMAGQQPQLPLGMGSRHDQAQPDAPAPARQESAVGLLKHVH